MWGLVVNVTTPLVRDHLVYILHHTSPAKLGYGSITAASADTHKVFNLLGLIYICITATDPHNLANLKGHVARLPVHGNTDQPHGPTLSS